MTPQDLSNLHTLAFPDERGWSASEFQALLDAPTTYLATDPSGFLLARFIADEAEILTLCTHPDTRRQGTASKLMARFMVDATFKGTRTAFLEVAEDNEAARALYAGFGFRQTGHRADYYARADARKVDCLVLSAPIPRT